MGLETQATGLAQTENVAGVVRPPNPATSGFDPLKGWSKLTWQLGYVAPRRIGVIANVRDELMRAVKV